MRIGIIGGGVVGQATARSYIEHVEEVRVYDVIKEKSTHTLQDVLQCDIIFVCLPTPQKKDSLECDTSYLEEFFDLKLGSANREEVARQRNFVLRSTVPIGTTKRLREKYELTNLVHSPEFLTARCAVTDAQLPARNIIGVPDWTSYSKENPCHWNLLQLYTDRFPHVPIYYMTSDESEAVKLFQNSFFAVKITFFNEINQLASKLELDWNTVLKGMLSDGRIHPSHTQVPGQDGWYGYGGTCLPKDLANLVYTMLNNGMGGHETNGRLLASTAHFCNIEHRKRT